jgi:hypothetical protein
MTQSATETNQIKDRNNNVLSLAQVDAFQRNGYHFPLRALSTEQVLAYRKRLETSESAVGGALRGSLRAKPHLLFTWANELIRLPKVIDAVEDILGPNLLAWSSSFFIKDAHDPSFVSWHQDSTYWGLSHPDVVSTGISAPGVSHVASPSIPTSAYRDACADNRYPRCRHSGQATTE